MARKRMFSLDVVDTDAFIDMPASARLLYYDLGMRADDDGFLQSAKRIMGYTGAQRDDINLLIAKGYVIPFESGVVVIRHWRQHNTIQSDRKKDTVCIEEKALLGLDASKRYGLLGTDKGLEPLCIQNGSKLEPQIRLDKDRVGEVSVSVEAQPSKQPNVLTDKVINALIREYDLLDDLYMRKALRDDAKKYGVPCLIQALASARKANENDSMTASFYRSHLCAETK